MTNEHNPIRVLCVSPLFAPAADSEAFCAAKLVRALTGAGAEVKVLTSESIRSKDRAFDASAMWKTTEQLIVDIPQPSGREMVRSIAAAARYQTKFYSRWVADAVREAVRLHGERKFDLVYSRSLPMIGHVVGYWCAKMFGVPWIANINDPWEFHFVPGLAYPKTSALNEAAYLFWLKRTLREADLVTYPCRQLHKFHEKLSGVSHHAEIVPHIGTRAVSKPARSVTASEFRLVHAGKLGSSEITGRSSNALLLALREFLNAHGEAKEITKLVLVGQKDSATSALVESLGLQNNVEVVGRVSYEESLNYIASASACVLVEADFAEGMFFPSKLADYLAARKPVLALSPRTGVVADLATQGGIYRVGCKDANAIQAAVESLYQDFMLNSLRNAGPSEALVQQFEPETVAQNFLTAVDSLMPATRHGVLGSYDLAHTDTVHATQ